MPNTPCAPETHTLELPWGACTYTLQRKTRRSIGLQITDQGLQISAPHNTSIADLHQILSSKATWIQRGLLRQTQRKQRATTLSELLHQQQPIPIQGIAYHISNSHTEHALLNPWTQHITLPKQTHTKQLATLEALLKTHAKTVFTQIAKQLAQRTTLPNFCIKLSSPSMRWGSCNSRGEIRLNWRLVHYPTHLIEYVIAHELAHLLEMNHSTRFWRVVAQLMPHYEEAHLALKHHTPSDVPNLQTPPI